MLVSYLLFIVAGSYCLLSSVEPNTALALQENLGVMWTIGTPLFFSCLLGAAALTFLLRAAANKALKYSFVALNVLFALIAAGAFNWAFSLYFFTQDRGYGFDVIDAAAVVQTNFFEALGYIQQFHGNLSLIGLFCGWLAVAALLVVSTRLLPHIQSRAWMLLPPLLCLAGGVLCSNFLPQTRLVTLTAASLGTVGDTLKAEQSKFSEIASLANKQQAFTFAQPIKNQDKLFIVVIGESQSRDIMSAYTNRFLNSTPFLSQMEQDYAVTDPKGTLKDWSFIKLRNAYASYTHTIQALSYAFTTTQVKDNPEADLTKFDYSHNIISALKAMGFRIAWISNQNQLGIYDTPVSAMISGADDQFFTSGDRLFYRPAPDGVLLRKLEQTLKQYESMQGGGVIFVHLMGNHFPYDKRYPQDFARFDFKSKKEMGIRMSTPPERLQYFNTYLDSIAYNDYVVSQITALAQQSKKLGGIFYFADHGDDPYLFSHEIRDFQPSMARIPAWFMVSRGYAEDNPEAFTNLVNNRAQIFVNDKVFETLLGFIGGQESTKALTSADYDGSPAANIFAINRSVWNDFYFTATQNALRGIIPMPFAHRCNSKFKAQTAIDLQINSIEMDVNYDGEQGFCIDHDVTDSDRMQLREVLTEFLPHLSNLWLDIKNFRSHNLNVVKDQLDLLAFEYPEFKRKAIIEVQDPTVAYVMARGGWKSSYYLDTAALLQNNLQYCQQVVKAVAELGLPVISYDWRAYELVQKEIVAKLQNKPMQLSWHMNLNFGSPTLQEELEPYAALTATCIPIWTLYDI